MDKRTTKPQVKQSLKSAKGKQSLKPAKHPNRPVPKQYLGPLVTTTTEEPAPVAPKGPGAQKPQTRNNRRRQQQRSVKKADLVGSAVADLVHQNEGLKDAIADLTTVATEVADASPAPIKPEPENLPKFGPVRRPYISLPCGCENGVRQPSCSASHVAKSYIRHEQDPFADVYVATEQAMVVVQLDEVEQPHQARKPDISLKATKWWNPFYKRSYTTEKLINRDHEGMKTKKIHDSVLNRELFTYLLSNRQEVYVNREQCITHLNALRRKFYDIRNYTPGNPEEPGYLDDEAVRVDLLTVARAADQKETEFLTQETRVYKKRGFSKALSTLFSRTYTA